MSNFISVESTEGLVELEEVVSTKLNHIIPSLRTASCLNPDGTQHTQEITFNLAIPCTNTFRLHTLVCNVFFDGKNVR